MSSHLLYTCLGLFCILCTKCCCGNYPLLDVDTNMRIVLVPQDTPVGTIVYRLRASDSDHNFPLTFEVVGAVGRTLLDIEFLGCSVPESLCQADVILRKPLDMGRTYDFQIRVQDTTGDFTRVKAAITSTEGTALTETMLGEKLLRVPENMAVRTELERFIVSKNEMNTRPVLLEIREPLARLELKQKLLSNNRTEGTLILKKELDFEKEPWFTFQLLALNGHTNSSVDTRNILVSNVAVLVTDVQDTPPRFTTPMTLIELSNNLRPGDLITQLRAEDGDNENKRLIRYGLLTESNPFIGFFDLNQMTGEIRLKRNLSGLFLMTKPNEPIRISIIAEEIIPEHSNFARHLLGESSEVSTVINVTFWYSEQISSGPPRFPHDRYYGEIKENSPVGTPVRFTLETKVWVSNGDSAIELDFLPPSANNVFTVSPKTGRGNFSFSVVVNDAGLLDFERTQMFRLQLKASTSSGLVSTVPVEIRVLDVNDNAPVFSQREYVAEINEMAPYGTRVIQVNATDKDSGLFGHVIYSSLVGSDAFRIDSESGVITVEKPMDLDRETTPELRLYVEAKDGGPSESNDPGFIRNVATGTVIVKLRDVNEPPECEAKYYQAVLNPELNGLKWPLYVKAIDGDSPGPNSEIRYQIVGDSRFAIDAVSGQLHVKYPIRFSSKDLESAYLGSFKVRAFDLGVPQMSTECTVQIYSEDVISQEIGFVFPSSPDQINRDRERLEKMISQLVGGHASIIAVSPFDSRSHSPPTVNQLIEKRLLGPESRFASLQEPQAPQAATSDQSVVLVSVQSPLTTKTRYVDLAGLREFMVTDQIVATTVAPPSSVSAAESRTLFWLLISLIILLLLLFALFICCLFCPCCLLFRGGRKSDRIEKHTREEFVDTRGHPRRSRKTHPVQVIESADEMDYVNYRGTREAWSGDNRQWRGTVPPRHPVGRRTLPPQHQVRGGGAEDMVVEDWEFAENTLPMQYEQGESRMEDIGVRWQPQQQLHHIVQPRRQVAYVGHPHPGDADFIRQDQYDRASVPMQYDQGMQVTPGRQIRQRSPTRSLPVLVSSDYQIEPTKQTPSRFYKTSEGEMLQLEYDGDGDEGKEMLMRRFISEQRPQGEQSPQVEDVPAKVAGPSRRRQLTPGKPGVGGIVEGEDVRIEQEPASDRPKAASILRRQNVTFDSLAPAGGREIDKIDEEDEQQIPLPGAVARKSRDEDKERESKSHRHHGRSHKEKDKDKARSKHKDTGKAKDKDERDKKKRERDKSESKSKSKSRSRSPKDEGDKAVQNTESVADTRRKSSLSAEVLAARESFELAVDAAAREGESATAAGERRSATEGGGQDASQSQLAVGAGEDYADEDSGIGLTGIANKRSKMLEKKSVFTIAYDEMATQNVFRPDTALNPQDLEAI